MLSSKAKYALRAAVFLAERYAEETWALASEIADSQDLPKKFLEAILVELRDHGIVDSRRGRYGGHRLSRPPDRVSVGDIICVIDGPLALTQKIDGSEVKVAQDDVDEAPAVRN